MPKFSSIAGLEEYVKRAVNNSLYAVGDFVAELESASVHDNVYEAYDPKQYSRRGNNGGLSDNSNMHVSVSNGAMTLTNDTPFGAGPVKATNLAGLVETGDDGGYGHYAYQYDYGYLQPRPFIQKTREALASTKMHVDILKEELEKYGFEVK